MLTIIAENGFSAPIPTGYVWFVVIIASVIAIALYALRSIGLFVMAKRQQIAHSYFAWIPFLWVYVLCKLVGETRFIGKKTYSQFAWIIFAIFTVASLTSLVYDFFVYFPLAGNFLLGRNIYIIENVNGVSTSLTPFWTGQNIYVDGEFVYPYGNGGGYPHHLIMPLTVISYVSSIFGMVSAIISIFAYLNLFKKFWPQHFILGAVLSVFGFFAPVVFAVRKREPVDYNEYIRARYQYYYGNPYGTPYGNPYVNNGANRQAPPEHPFSEFAERGEVDPGDPFEEFISTDDKKKN